MRRSVKKTISFVVLANMLVAGLVGCGDVSDSSSAAATTKATTASTTSESVSSTTTSATTTETTTTKKTTTESKSKTTTTTKKTEAETTQQTKQVGGDNGYIEDDNDYGGHNYDDYVEPAQTEAPQTTTQRKTEAATITTTKATKKETTTTQDNTDYYVSVGDIYFSGPLDINQIFLENNKGDYVITNVTMVSNSDNAKVDITRHDNYVEVICWESTDVTLSIEVKSKINGKVKYLTTKIVA